MTDDALAEIRALRERLARLEALATATGDPPMPLTYETVKRMGRAEITSRWDEVQAALAAGPTRPGRADPAGPAKPLDPAADLRREMFGAEQTAPAADPPGPPALTREDIRKMSPDMINADWPRVSEALKGTAR